ncbi:hypothetical protein MNBD_ALPHA06-814 [hydrothermal vent metagenome]|uniref:FOG: TPR repeat, SEL1 subfamily n=1 Tax=hydrothermal vent metagenome TaxID=652676 RepID=A0A3B0RVX0_9ZZZZ
MRILCFVIVGLLLSCPVMAQDTDTTTIDTPKLDFGFDLASGNDASQAWQAWQQEDYVQARSLAAIAGAKGDASAQLLFGILLDNGFGGTEDPAQAVKWYKEAAENDEINGWLALAGIAFEQRGGLSIADGRGFLKHAAEARSTEAMLALGRAYASGHGGELDEKQAEFWFLQAINNGVNPARVALADLYLSQDKQDDALALYETAVFGGSAEAALKAGLLQADPQSQVYAPQQAGQQLLTAAQAGDAKAMTNYGLFLATKTPPLPATAARWFRKAANADEPEGQYLFAVSLAKGEGVLMDREAAYEWALRASAQQPEENQYSHLAEILGQSLLPSIRDLIHARAQMPLRIAITEPTASLDPNPSAD